LTIRIPPKTTEDRQATAKEAKRITDDVLGLIRKARQDKHGQLQKLKKSNTIRPEQFHDLEQKMDKIVQKGNDDAKKISDAAKQSFA
jgi:ribosome recycling factor